MADDTDVSQTAVTEEKEAATAPAPAKAGTPTAAAGAGVATKATPTEVIVDGTGLVAGRLASNVAKMLLQGTRVSIVNCENVMISGTRSNIIREYRDFLKIASILNPKHGPFHPRRPDTMVARMIRGMLPRKKPSGKTALSRLRTYIGTPKNIGSLDRVELQKARVTRAPANYTTMADLGRTIGWTE